MDVHLMIPLLDVQLTSLYDQFNEDMFASSYLGRYLDSFTSKFYVQRIWNISLWVWKCCFWKGAKGCRKKRGNGPIKSSTDLWTNQFPVSFTAFFEKIKSWGCSLQIRFYRCRLKVGFDVFHYYVKLGARMQNFLNLVLVI